MSAPEKPAGPPAVLHPRSMGIPAELHPLARFVLWQLRRKPGETRYTKVPLYLARDERTARRSLTFASVDRPETWASLEQVLPAYIAGFSDEGEPIPLWATYEGRPADGIGLVVVGDVYLIADFDGCVRPDRTIEPWAAFWINKLWSYTEYSPSQSGIHVITRAPAPWLAEAPAGAKVSGCIKVVLPGQPSYGEHDLAAVELLWTGRYCALTGHLVEGFPATIEERSEVVEDLHAWLVEQNPRGVRCAWRAEAGAGATAGPVAVVSPALEDTDVIARCRTRSKASGEKFEALFYRGDVQTYHHGDDSAADMALASLLSHYTQDTTQLDSLMRKSELVRPKWDEARGSGTYLSLTIAKALAYAEGEFWEGDPEPPEDVATQTAKLAQEPAGAPPKASVAKKPRQPQGVWIAGHKVEITPPKWLWARYILRGHLNMLAGDGDVGKSFLSCKMGAHITTGTPWPDGSSCPLGDVLFVPGEDDESTIAWRLKVMGANLERVHILQGIDVREADAKDPLLVRLSLTKAIHVAEVERKIKEVGAVLTILDPAEAFLEAGTKTNDGVAVRQVTNPLADMAKRTDSTSLVVVHLNKSTLSDAIHRISGHQGWFNAPRAALVAGHDPDSENGRRLLLPFKMNLAEKPPGFGYRIDGASGLYWDGPATMTAKEMLKARPQGTETGALNKRELVKKVLRGLLRYGPQRTGIIYDVTRACEIGDRTVDAAKAELGISSRSAGTGKNKQWWWEPPAGGFPDAAPDPEADLDPQT